MSYVLGVKNENSCISWVISEGGYFLCQLTRVCHIAVLLNGLTFKSHSRSQAQLYGLLIVMTMTEPIPASTGWNNCFWA